MKTTTNGVNDMWVAMNHEAHTLGKEINRMKGAQWAYRKHLQTIQKNRTRYPAPGWEGCILTLYTENRYGSTLKDEVFTARDIDLLTCMKALQTDIDDLVERVTDLNEAMEACVYLQPGQVGYQNLRSSFEGMQVYKRMRTRTVTKYTA